MLDQPSVRSDLSAALAEVGIPRARQRLLGRTDPSHAHMETYREVDLCLDSFPYNGTTTNCDSFVMGVPVVALTGDRHASRVTTSQLHALGLGKLAAVDIDQYVDIAVQLGSDMEKLAGIRQGLRERMLNSPLTDYTGFTRQLEDQYRDIWRQWCAGS
jgi:predicted O-linked N-acetylglucosamine transferase (SPINDLY family)